MAFNLERSNNLKLLQSSDSTLSRQTMRSLAEYDSEGNPELEDTSPVPPDEAPGQHRMLPDVDAIIKETRVDIKETRQKADKLFHQFAKSYVATAGELREGAIQKYRERLEGLTAEDRAKVCETLAKDEIVCSMMQFGENRYSFGGVSFRYNTQNDAAFNRLSHHAWKDLHEVFVKDDPHSLVLGNALEKSRFPQAPPIHSEDEKEAVQPSPERSRNSSEESELSSIEEDSVSYGDSNGPLQTSKSERCRNNLSPSPDSAEEDQAGRSDAPKKRAPVQPSDKGEWDASEKRGPTKPQIEPWSEEEEAVIREMMAAQLQMDGHLGYSRQAAMELKEVFPRRSTAAIRSKWLSMRTKDIWDGWRETRGKPQVLDAKSKVVIGNPDFEICDEKDSASSTEFDDDDDDDYSDHEARIGLRDLHSGNKYKWTTEQDRILGETMLREMQSAGVEHMSVPLTVKKELARSFGLKERAISRRWLLLSGRGTGLKEWKTKTKVVPVLDKTALQEQERAPETYPQLLHLEILRQSEGAVASGPQHEIGPTRDHHASTWSPQEIEILTTLTRGLHRSADIDFKHVAAQMPDPSRRTVDACRRYWDRHVKSPQRSQGKGPINGNEASRKRTSSVNIYGFPKLFKKARKAKDTSDNILVQSETVHETSQGHRQAMGAWTPEEDDILARLAVSNITWNAISDQIPGRSASACRSRYCDRLVKMPQYQKKLKRRSVPPERGHAGFGGAPNSAVRLTRRRSAGISVPGESKHARESGDGDRQRSVPSRNRHSSEHAQSSSSQDDHNDDSEELEESESQDSDVSMYEIE